MLIPKFGSPWILLLLFLFLIMDHIFLFLHMSNILKIILQCCQREVIENLAYLPLMGVDASSIRPLNSEKSS